MTVLLDFVYRLTYKTIKLQRFTNLILQPSSGKMPTSLHKSYLLGSLAEIARDLICGIIT